jgi:hypothetical protein
MKLHMRDVTFFHTNVEDHIFATATGGFHARNKNVRDFVDAIFGIFT